MTRHCWTDNVERFGGVAIGQSKSFQGQSLSFYNLTSKIFKTTTMTTNYIAIQEYGKLMRKIVMNLLFSHGRAFLLQRQRNSTSTFVFLFSCFLLLLLWSNCTWINFLLHAALPMFSCLRRRPLISLDSQLLSTRDFFNHFLQQDFPWQFSYIVQCTAVEHWLKFSAMTFCKACFHMWVRPRLEKQHICHLHCRVIAVTMLSLLRIPRLAFMTMRPPWWCDCDDVDLWWGHLDVFNQDSALLLRDVLANVDDNAAIPSVPGQCHPPPFYQQQKAAMQEEEEV